MELTREERETFIRTNDAADDWGFFNPIAHMGAKTGAARLPVGEGPAGGMVVPGAESVRDHKEADQANGYRPAAREPRQNPF